MMVVRNRQLPTVWQMCNTSCTRQLLPVWQMITTLCAYHSCRGGCYPRRVVLCYSCVTYLTRVPHFMLHLYHISTPCRSQWWSKYTLYCVRNHYLCGERSVMYRQTGAASTYSTSAPPDALLCTELLSVRPHLKTAVPQDQLTAYKESKCMQSISLLFTFNYPFAVTSHIPHAHRAQCRRQVVWLV